MRNYSETYIMFNFEWSTAYQGYEYAFNCSTGQIENDHGLLNGNQQDFRFVTGITGLTRFSDIEWNAMGNDLFDDDLKEIGKALAIQAGGLPDNINTDFVRSMRKPPADGEGIFVWLWKGGIDPATSNGPEEGWSDVEFIGELGSVSIHKKGNVETLVKVWSQDMLKPQDKNGNPMKEKFPGLFNKMFGRRRK